MLAAHADRWSHTDKAEHVQSLRTLGWFGLLLQLESRSEVQFLDTKCRKEHHVSGDSHPYIFFCIVS